MSNPPLLFLRVGRTTGQDIGSYEVKIKSILFGGVTYNNVIGKVIDSQDVDNNETEIKVKFLSWDGKGD